ncbi:ferritin-like domain-containing protein [Allosaccharopolyspora coralli]|uniref:Ferritin-like domain-containing protein n=1 Tax=Allosaccharopolyspora coralli TaxID=2665642 RepID=A0A5Q3Q156_9PSEU|nr:ferritin-like domain-containing protein [Allosaccharopolyspora coralli]QGK68212.1 ferritin-like domain-containing protein [Allosaccharopolyspora coralli]
MFGKQYIAGMINRSAENETDRRRFLRSAGIGGLGVVGASALSSSVLAGAASAQEQPSDAAVLNFALNLEYLEGQFYSFAVNGAPLPDSLTGGHGERGPVTGGRQVKFRSKKVKQYAEEIAADERAHVEFLRSALGSAAVGQPPIDLQNSFTAAAQAAGLVEEGEPFDAFANEENFLLAAFLFEDVGVTAYKGAAPLITNATYLEAAAGILAAEAYHAANIRTVMTEMDTGLLGTGLLSPNYADATAKLSDARDSLDGADDLDQGIETDGRANIVPTDEFGVTYSRSAGQVLNVVYLTNEAADSGGFFPRGVNGDITMSEDNT